MSQPSSTDASVAYIATLARLELTAGEMARLQRDLEGVLGYVQLLQQVDVTGVEPTAHAAPVANVFRTDAAVEPNSNEAVLANAPAVVGSGLIRVPVVLGGEEGS